LFLGESVVTEWSLHKVLDGSMPAAKGGEPLHRNENPPVARPAGGSFR
jgi:hypothetical protein